MPAPKGSRPSNAGKGRLKGAANRMNRALREMILGALDDAGGQAYLAEQARENPIAFIALLGRLLPREPLDSPPQKITLDFGWKPPTPAPLPPLCHDNHGSNPVGDASKIKGVSDRAATGVPVVSRQSSKLRHRSRQAAAGRAIFGPCPAPRPPRMRSGAPCRR
jgi:hypothetical protein